MFKLYTDKKKIPENYELIEFVDAYFDTEVIMEPLSLSDNTELRAIDRSQLDKSMLNVVTPFGAIGLCWTIIQQLLTLVIHLTRTHLLDIKALSIL